MIKADLQPAVLTRRIHTPTEIYKWLRKQRYSGDWGTGKKAKKIPEMLNQLAAEGEDIWLENGAKSFQKTERPNKQDLVAIDFDFHERLADYSDQCNAGQIEKFDTDRKIGIEDVYINFVQLAYQKKKLNVG